MAATPKGKGEGTSCFQETRIPQQHRRCYHFFLTAHQTKKGMSRAASHLSHLFREPKASSVDLLLAFLSNHLPTKKKQPRAARICSLLNLKIMTSLSSVSIQGIVGSYTRKPWGESQESVGKACGWFFATLWKERKIYF